MSVEDVLQWWSFVFLGVVVYFFLEQVKKLFPGLVKKPWFSRTIVFHAPVLATAIAVLPFFPMPESIGGEIGTRVLFGLVAGITCAWSYKAMMRLLGKDHKSSYEKEEE